RALAGAPGLSEALCGHAARELAAHPNALWLLANDTLSHLPPLTLLRGLVVQLDGAQSNRSDLRKTALGPVADAARVFAVGSGGAAGGGTLQRLAAASARRPGRAAVF